MPKLYTVSLAPEIHFNDMFLVNPEVSLQNSIIATYGKYENNSHEPAYILFKIFPSQDFFVPSAFYPFSISYIGPIMFCFWRGAGAFYMAHQM